MFTQPNIYWADLHNHNEIGYGKGVIERSYIFAKNSLDVYAFTPHAWWPDPPSNDPKIRDYHVNAADSVAAAYPKVIEQANRANVSGKFTSFIAYEWHSSGWGDYVILFPEDSGSIFRAANLIELQDFVRSQKAIMVPHHVAYCKGWRGLDWSGWCQEVSPLSEIFSEHGNTFESETHWPMLAHSMGGSCRSQTVVHQIQKGRFLGFTGGTDNHFGYPASYCEGITGIHAPELTRESIFSALKARHTFATSGDRIEMSFQCGEQIMGDICKLNHPREFEISIKPQAPLAFVELYKNGKPFQHWSKNNGADPSDNDSYLVRIDWGWGRMESSEITHWEIHILLHDGVIAKTRPYFCGGAASSELVNLCHVISENEIAIGSFTSRLNVLPTCGIVLEIKGSLRTQLTVDVKSQIDKTHGGTIIQTNLQKLQEDDFWQAANSMFSSPKIRIGKPYAKNALEFKRNWRDPEEHRKTGDSYLVKAQQVNGQVAYTSPIYFLDAY